MRSMTRVEAIPYESMRPGMPWDWVTFPEFLDSLDAHAEGAQRAAVRAGRAAARRGARPRRRQGRARCRPTTSTRELAAMLARGDGRRRVRLVGAAPAPDRPGRRAARLRRHADADRRHARRDVPRARPRARRAQPGRPADHADDRRHPPRHRPPRGARRAVGPAAAAQRRAGVRGPARTCTASAIAWLERCRERGIPVYGQGVTTDAGFTFTFEDWNLYDDSEAWMEATTGTLEERLHKLGRPGPPPGPQGQAAERGHGAARDGDGARRRSRPRREPFREMSVRQVADSTGQAPGRRDARHRRRRRPAHAVLRRAAAGLVGPAARRSSQYPHMLFGVSDGGAHTKFLTAGRYPTETLAQQVRDNELDHLRGRPPAAVRAARAARRLPRPRAAPRRRPGRRRRLRPRAPRASARTRSSRTCPAASGGGSRRRRGYHAVFVNGVRTIADDTQTERHPGRLLRHGRG